MSGDTDGFQNQRALQREHGCFMPGAMVHNPLAARVAALEADLSAEKRAHIKTVEIELGLQTENATLRRALVAAMDALHCGSYPPCKLREAGYVPCGGCQALKAVHEALGTERIRARVEQRIAAGHASMETPEAQAAQLRGFIAIGWQGDQRPTAIFTDPQAPASAAIAFDKAVAVYRGNNQPPCTCGHIFAGHAAGGRCEGICNMTRVDGQLWQPCPCTRFVPRREPSTTAPGNGESSDGSAMPKSAGSSDAPARPSNPADAALGSDPKAPAAVGGASRHHPCKMQFPNLAGPALRQQAQAVADDVDRRILSELRPGPLSLLPQLSPMARRFVESSRNILRDGAINYGIEVRRSPEEIEAASFLTVVLALHDTAANRREPKPPSIYARALKRFGFPSQLIKLAEECAELGAIAARLANNLPSRGSLADEIADVEIMIAQMRFHFGDAGIDAAKVEKLAKLEARMADPSCQAPGGAS